MTSRTWQRYSNDTASSSRLKVGHANIAAMFATSALTFESALMRLLIVGDEEHLPRSLEKAMGEGGYAGDSAADGGECFDRAESNDYDAIVLDVMLPGKDGWEILSRLRKSKRTSVLMLTARDGVRDRVKGLDLGADDYLVKPFNLTELIARLRALIRRSAAEANPQLEIGDVEIKTTTC